MVAVVEAATLAHAHALGHDRQLDEQQQPVVLAVAAADATIATRRHDRRGFGRDAG